jgi:GGDEF domain-containing protein
LREQAFSAAGQVFTVTQSVGIAQVVEGDANWALKVADRNLYQAKRAGRDTIVGSVAFASVEPSSLSVQGACHV